MISLMMLNAGLDPTVHLGADLEVFDGTVRTGSDSLLVSEACEFKESFLNFSSTTAVITNIDHDHVDCYPTIDDVIDVFARFIRLVDDAKGAKNNDKDNFFYTGSVISGSVKGFAWYDNAGNETVDPNIIITVGEKKGDSYTVTVSSK